MRYHVFHSRTGAAALAAALLYLGDCSRETFFDMARGLPDAKRFLLCQETDDETVLAVSSGKEHKVLKQALVSLANEFRPKTQVSICHCQPEPKHLTTRLWLIKHHLVPSLLQRLWDEQLWRLLRR